MPRTPPHRAVPSPRRHRLAVLLASFLLAVLPVATLAQDDGLPAATPLSTESLALERINRYRASAGVPPMAAHPALMEAAAGHIRYYEANQGSESLVGMGLHEQNPEAPGFTCVEMDDRAKAAGYTDGTVTKNS